MAENDMLSALMNDPHALEQALSAASALLGGGLVAAPRGLDGLADARCGLCAYALCQGASLLALQKLSQRAQARVILRQIELM